MRVMHGEIDPMLEKNMSRTIWGNIMIRILDALDAHSRVNPYTIYLELAPIYGDVTPLIGHGSYG